MKVFEVSIDYCPDDSKEVIREVNYVTSKEDTLLSVTEYYTRHCHEYEKDLISVREALTVNLQIR